MQVALEQGVEAIHASVGLLQQARPLEENVTCRSAAEVARTVSDLSARGITLRCLRNGLDTASASGRVVVAVLSELAMLDADDSTESARRS